MSFELPSQHRRAQPRVRWLAASFLVEAMLLLLFVMASLAVITSMLAESAERAAQSQALTDAVTLATTAAERFSADPLSAPTEGVAQNLVFTCDVTSDAREGGTMYKASIAVYEADGQALAGIAARKAAREEREGAREGEQPEARANALPQVKGTPLYKLSTEAYESEA